jgi:hypothetical protein
MLMAETKVYTGGCHCGQIRFEATADLSSVIACNCSICSTRGLLLAFVPVQSFALRAGGEDLSEYRFHKKVIRHQFCRACGVEAFARGTAPDGTEMIALNVRCLDGVDVAKLATTPVDGRSL